MRRNNAATKGGTNKGAGQEHIGPLMAFTCSTRRHRFILVLRALNLPRDPSFRSQLHAQQ
jgi:hypothetical protein